MIRLTIFYLHFMGQSECKLLNTRGLMDKGSGNGE